MRVGRVSAHGVIAEAALVLGCLRVHLRPVDQGRVCVLVGGGEPVSLQHQLCEDTPPAPTDWGAGPPRGRRPPQSSTPESGPAPAGSPGRSYSTGGAVARCLLPSVAVGGRDPRRPSLLSRGALGARASGRWPFAQGTADHQ